MVNALTKVSLFERVCNTPFNCRIIQSVMHSFDLIYFISAPDLDVKSKEGGESQEDKVKRREKEMLESLKKEEVHALNVF